MEVIAGTYSHLLFGYEVKLNDEQKLKFSTSFTNDSHAGLVKCVAANGKGFVASGSADESIRLFNLKGRKCEVGTLCQHNGSVVGLRFFKNSHLFSASDDGTIAIWRVGTWECLKLLKHKDAVVDFAIHPSGKLLLSTTKGRTLQTWNLVSGRRAFVTNLKQAGDMILFSSEGDKFVVVMGNNIDIYSTDGATVIHTINHTSKVSAVTFLKNHILLVGDEKGVVNFFDLTSFKLLHQLKTNTIRVKGISCCSSSSKIFVISSDGYIKLYEVHIQEHDAITTNFITGVVTPHRWLCMTLYDHDDNDGGDDDDEEENDMLSERKIRKNKLKNLKKSKGNATAANDDDGESDDDDGGDGDDDEMSELEEDDGDDEEGDDDDDDGGGGDDGGGDLKTKKRKLPFQGQQMKKQKRQKFNGDDNDDNDDGSKERKVRAPWKQSKNKAKSSEMRSSKKFYNKKSNDDDDDNGGRGGKFKKGFTQKKSVRFADDKDKKKKQTVRFANDVKNSKKRTTTNKNNKFKKFNNDFKKSPNKKFNKKQRINKRRK